MNSLLLNDVLPPPGELPEGKRVTDSLTVTVTASTCSVTPCTKRKQNQKLKIGHEKKIRKKQTLFRGFHIYLSLSRIHPS